MDTLTDARVQDKDPLAKANADRAALVEALEEIKDDIEDCDECRCDEVLEIARAALATVKGAA